MGGAARVRLIESHTAMAAAREVNYFLNENRRRRRPRYNGEEEGMSERESEPPPVTCVCDRLSRDIPPPTRRHPTMAILSHPSRYKNLLAIQPPTSRSHGPAARARVPPPPPPSPRSARPFAGPLQPIAHRHTADEYRRRPRLRAPAHTPTIRPERDDSRTYSTSTNLAGSRTCAVHILYVRSCQSGGR